MGHVGQSPQNLVSPFSRHSHSTTRLGPNFEELKSSACLGQLIKGRHRVNRRPQTQHAHGSPRPLRSAPPPRLSLSLCPEHHPPALTCPRVCENTWHCLGASSRKPGSRSSPPPPSIQIRERQTATYTLLMGMLFPSMTQGTRTAAVTASNAKLRVVTKFTCAAPRRCCFCSLSLALTR